MYKTVIRTVLLYGSGTWAIKNKDKEKLERTEMKVLRWIWGMTLNDRLKSEEIRRLGMVRTIEKLQEARLRWFGHVKRICIHICNDNNVYV